MTNLEEIMQAISIGLVIATFLLNTGRALKTIELCKESSFFLNQALKIEEQITKRIYGAIYRTKFHAYSRISDNTNAITYGKKLLIIYRECDHRVQEGKISMRLVRISYSQSMYAEIKELCERAIIVKREVGDRAGEAACYNSLGAMLIFPGQFVKAKIYLEKELKIRMEIGDRAGEAACYKNLGVVFQSLRECVKATECLEKALVIVKEIGDKENAAACYRILGTVFQPLGEYAKAQEYLEKALVIVKEIGDKEGEATCYKDLGTVFRHNGEFGKAIKYLEKALVIVKEIGDKEGEATCYKDLGTVFGHHGEYFKATEYLEKALVVVKEIGDKAGEAACYGDLGTVFEQHGEYVKATEYLEKALVVSKEIGDRGNEAAWYRNLGNMFSSLGEYVKATEYLEKAVAIFMEIGDKAGLATSYTRLASVWMSLRKYGQAKEYLDQALAISTEIGDRVEEVTCYEILGTLFRELGDNVKAKEYHEKSLPMALEIGNRKLAALNYEGLASTFLALGKHVMAEECFEKALSVSENRVTDPNIERIIYWGLTVIKMSQKRIQDAIFYLFQILARYEKMRGVNIESDQIKISLADLYVLFYLALSDLFYASGKPDFALYAVELARARSLADLMATQYSAEIPTSVDPKSWIGIENVMKKQNNCTLLYISYRAKDVFLWILERSGAINLRILTVDDTILRKRLVEPARNLDEYFAIMAESFRSFGLLPEEVCEDRSFNDIESEKGSCQEENLEPSRQGKPGITDDPKPSLTLLYEMLINPVLDLLKEPEIIIVPDRGLYRVPFPALLNDRGKYLSETFRIRVVPSLTTLGLIQNSPVDYHSQTGALVVGDPDVGAVIYRGKVKEKFLPLTGARKEAEMIGRMLGVKPLIGQHATKKAVLERIHSVSLIHIAAHGNAERGEIALAPPGSITGTPQEDDYLLKMSDISKIQVRAKLVVLSCCHSGRGQIRAEGVVGIARAFLGSGARSVLVALWAVEDRITVQLMSRFYENLVRGESASESLHHATKWMRDNGFIEVHDWAPFMLIGDNVSFTFAK